MNAAPPATSVAAALVEDYLYLVPTTVRRMIRAPAREIPALQAAALDEGDLVSIGYRALVKASASWRPDGGVSFRNYAITHIRWQVANALKAASREVCCLSLDAPAPASLGQPEAPRLGDLVADKGTGTEEAALARLQRAHLVARIAALPEKQQEVMRRYYVEDQTFDEIGPCLGVSRQRCQQIHAAALKSLRTTLMPFPPE